MSRFRVVWRGRVDVFMAWPMEGEGGCEGDILLRVKTSGYSNSGDNTVLEERRSKRLRERIRDRR